MESEPFSFVLSDDKTKLAIELHKAVFDYSASELEQLIRLLANLRSRMNPAIPDSCQGIEQIEGDRYEVFQHRLNGTSQIYLRIPGIGWSFVALSKEQSLRLSETLNPPPTAPEHAPRH